MQHRFEDAVQSTEQAFIDDVTKLVNHLTDRLQGTADGKPGVFQFSAISNVTEIFDRLRPMNVLSDGQLVQSSQGIQQSVKPDVGTVRRSCFCPIP